MFIIALGVALNVLAIGLNGGMPTKDDVKERNGREVHVPIERTVKHKPRESDDMLPFLGDVITAPGVPNQQFSVGDIVIGIGVVDLCFEASRRPRRRGVPICPKRTRRLRRDRGEQAGAIERDLERAEHPRVVDVARRRVERFERGGRASPAARATARRTRS